MADGRKLAVQEKKETPSKEEKTIPARYFTPPTDIYETENDLTVVMEVPGVEKKDITVGVENGVLHVDAQIDFSKYEGLGPVYAEYNVGHYRRAFSLSDKIDQDGISAELSDGVLKLKLNKSKEARPRRIEIK
jgi:HSP20 family molecular chaperone IbpA